LDYGTGDTGILQSKSYILESCSFQIFLKSWRGFHSLKMKAIKLWDRGAVSELVFAARQCLHGTDPNIPFYTEKTCGQVKASPARTATKPVRLCLQPRTTSAVRNC